MPAVFYRRDMLLDTMCDSIRVPNCQLGLSGQSGLAEHDSERKTQ
ncbi:hypothetical protein [Vibrio sp. CAU 1672]|nr:hypothetical protein [Vibrio sp. CAU 1672]MDF2154700.1 hypothetical protein [Vibrio sp. CAU 1672]